MEQRKKIIESKNLDKKIVLKQADVLQRKNAIDNLINFQNTRKKNNFAHILKRISGFFPSKIRENFQNEIDFAGLATENKVFIGIMVLYSIGLGLAIGFIAQLFFQFNFLIAFIASAILLIIASYAWLYLLAENKARFVEKILPDALQLIASNIKSGMTTERALFISARPEFGVLQTELKNASNRIIAGERIEIALLSISKKIKSKRLSRAMQLIVQGIESGGQIANLLIQMAEDLRQESLVQEEAKASIALYQLMIWAVSAVGAPALLAISTVIVKIINTEIGSIPAIGVGGVQALARGVESTTEIAANPVQPIPLDFIIMFSVIMLIVSTVYSAMIIGIISKGNEKQGLRYLPILLIIALIVFFVAREMAAQILLV